MQLPEGLGDGPEDLLGLGLGQAVLRFGEQVVVERVGPAVFLDE